MDNPPSITFEKIRNGRSNSFPRYACNIFFLDGCPDLLHIKRTEICSEASRIAVTTFRNGENCDLFETMSSHNVSWHCSDGKSLSITNRDSRIGVFISYEDGSLIKDRVLTPEDTWLFIRSTGANYFILGTLDSGFSLMTSILDRPLLKWKKSKAYPYFVNNDIILCHSFKASRKIEKYVLLNEGYCSVGDNFIVFVGLGDLAIVDFSTMEVIRFTFPTVSEKIDTLAARFTRHDLAEIFFSVINETDCNIYKASISRSELEGRFDSQKFTKQSNRCDTLAWSNNQKKTKSTEQKYTSAYHRTNLQELEKLRDLRMRSGNDELRQKFAALSAENNELKKIRKPLFSPRQRCTEQEPATSDEEDSSVESGNETLESQWSTDQEPASIELRDDSIISVLQAKLKALGIRRRNYNMYLLVISSLVVLLTVLWQTMG